MRKSLKEKSHKLIEAWKDPVKRAKWSKAIRAGQEEAKAWKKELARRKGELMTGDLA